MFPFLTLKCHSLDLLVGMGSIVTLEVVVILVDCGPWSPILRDSSGTVVHTSVVGRFLYIGLTLVLFYSLFGLDPVKCLSDRI